MLVARDAMLENRVMGTGCYYLPHPDADNHATLRKLFILYRQSGLAQPRFGFVHNPVVLIIPAVAGSLAHGIAALHPEISVDVDADDAAIAPEV